MTGNRKRFGWWHGVALCVAITCVSHQPVVIPEILDFSHQDKIIHALVYGLIATAWLRWFLTFNSRTKAAWMAITLTAAFGVTDEVHQSFVPGRFADLSDWVADTFGAILATFCYMKWTLYRSILEWPKSTRQAA